MGDRAAPEDERTTHWDELVAVAVMILGIMVMVVLLI